MKLLFLRHTLKSSFSKLTPGRPFAMASTGTRLKTRILKTDPVSLSVRHSPDLEELEVTYSATQLSASTQASLREASSALHTSDYPVAFPTETVYGLAADATRSSAVRGIYRAKNRPVDNPLIVHICSLLQLRTLLAPGNSEHLDPIPEIYRPLIRKFWPGPLTILMPVSTASARCLAPEVTAGLSTFGARMPASPLALALLKESDLPLAAPSANASTRPSPTRAEHVLHDLDGRIELIVDGGSCSVGVESTVVDGLSSPPAILRPGGISLEMIRQVPGWEGVVKAYKDHAEGGDAEHSESGVQQSNNTSSISNGHHNNINAHQNGGGPRAPGMKYKHYSPTAKVALFNADTARAMDLVMITKTVFKSGRYGSLGVLRATSWSPLLESKVREGKPRDTKPLVAAGGVDNVLDSGSSERPVHFSKLEMTGQDGQPHQIYDTQLGATPATAARNLFHALRELDRFGVDLILVEGLEVAGDGDGSENSSLDAINASPDSEAAAAVMNRLRKAATIIIDSPAQAQDAFLGA